MREPFHGGVPLGRFTAESFEDDVVKVSRNVMIQPARRYEVFLWLFSSTCRAVFAWGSPCDQFVENGAEGEDIRSDGLNVSANLFRTCVGRRKQPIDGSSPVARLSEHLRDAKIQQFRGATGIDENVRGLQITMDDGMAVRMRNCRADRAGTTRAGLADQAWMHTRRPALPPRTP